MGSFNDEYLKLRKKRQEEAEEENNKSSVPYQRPLNNSAAFPNNSYLDRVLTGDVGDIAPLPSKSSKDEEKERTWFDSGALNDGYQFGDVTKTILGSIVDIGENVGAGIIGLGEKTVDALAVIGQMQSNQILGESMQSEMAFAALTGKDAGKVVDKYTALQEESKKATTDFVKKDLYNEEDIANKIISAPIKDLTGIDSETDSVFGEKSDALAQSAGQLGATVALQALGVPWWLTTGVATFGSETEGALNQNATIEEAALSGLVSAGAEILTEKISGGISFGGKTLDDALTKQLAVGISNKTVRTLTKIGVDMVGEGGEEILSGVLSAVGQKLTYAKDKELDELFSSEEAFESFIGGAVLGGGSSAINAVKSKVNGVDAVTELTKNEQAVFDKVYQAELEAKAEEKGGKLTNKEKSAIYDKVMNDFEKGYISTDIIEEVLGGEDYSNYQSELKRQQDIDNELKILRNMKSGDMTDIQIERMAELKAMTPNTELVNSLKFGIDEKIRSSIQGTRLMESYNENARRGQVFEADLSKYDSKQAEVIKKAIDSGILNNTNRTHEFVDMVAKISADKGVLFDFANNAKLKESGFGVNGKFVNGYVTKDGITVNIDSNKALNSIVGHEITHVLEGTELYAALKVSIQEYAKSKGEYQSRLDTLTKLYEGVEGADVSAELTADLVGDYLFSDSDFINHLSTTNRNVFQKIFDEIKYLYKVATAGSKQARELEKVKRAFENAYRESGQKNTAKESGAKYALSRDIDGNVFVDVTEDIFDENNGESIARTIQRVIHDKFNNLIDVHGQKIQINKTTNDEFRRSESAISLLKNSTQTYNDKLKTIANADEILSAAKNWIGEEIQHTRSDDIVEFARGNITYRVGENGYVADVIVGTRKNGSAVLYDLVNIYSKKIAEAPVTMASNENFQRRQGTSADDIISQNSQKSIGNTKFSLSDSEGRKLTKEQADFFKDSKIRDKDGNLKVMYHGSSETFTVFDKSKAKSYGTYGNGFYFTDSTSHAGTYGNTIDVYLNITNPLQNGTNDITKEQLRKFVEVIAENEDYGIENYGYDATIDSVTDSVWGKGDFGMILDLNITCVGNMVEAIQLFNEVNGTDYNGIVVPTETVAFYPNQIKNVDNTKPTENPDIRYSLSDSEGKQLTNEQREYFKDSKMRDDNGNLKVMYHGSQDAGFHTFDANMSDDDTSLFFVDRNDVAASYSGTSETYAPKAFKSVQDANKFFEEINATEYEVVENDGKYTLLDDGDEVATSDDLAEIYEEWRDWSGLGYGDANYKVYLNLTNPLVVDAEGRNWNNISREFSQEIADRYHSLTADERAALTDLAEWGEYGIFRDEILSVAKDIANGKVNDANADIASAYKKLGGANANFYDAFSIASENFSEESIKQFAVKQFKTRDYAQKAKAEGYDGVIFKNIHDNGGYSNGDEGASTVAIAFESNQIKSIANEKPTADKDIRFSLSESVEETKDLMAIHNLSEEKLLKSLKLGGLPMPSVAIAKAKDGHNEFGNISLILQKNAIDPKTNRYNKVYSGDAWTPTYPRVEYKVNSKVLEQISDKVHNLVPSDVISDLGRISFDTDNMTDDLNRWGGNVVDAFGSNDALKYAYLKDIGADVTLPMKEKNISYYGYRENGAIIKVAEALTVEELREAINSDSSYEIKDKYEPIIRKAVAEYVQEKYGDNPELLEIMMPKEQLTFSDLDGYLTEALSYHRKGVEQMVDTKAARELIKEQVNQSEYEAWLRDLFSGIVEKEGIRNNADYFTPSGNRRSFEALHYEHNLENVIKAMREKGTKGIGVIGSGNIFGASTTEFGSIKELKESADRLKMMSQDEYDEIRKEYSDRFFDLAYRLPINKDSFTATSDAGDMLVEAVAKYSTRSGIANHLKKESQGWANYSEDIVDDLIELVNDIRQMPTGYFEAKPQRAVGFDEVGVFVIPYNADPKLKQELLNRGYSIAEYDPNIGGDRQKVVNSFEEYKFSLSNVNAAPTKAYGNYNVYGKDIGLPGADDIAPVGVAENAITTEEADYLPEDYAPIENSYTIEQELDKVQAEIDALVEEGTALYNNGEEAKAMELMERINELSNKARTLTERANILKAQEEAELKVYMDSLTDADIPAEAERVYSEAETTQLDEKTLKKLTKGVRDALSCMPKESKAIREVIENYSKSNQTKSELFRVLKEKFGDKYEYHRYSDIAEAKKHLRNTKFAISDHVKGDIADFSDFKKQHGIRNSKNALSVDVVYEELVELYPGLFPSDIANETDRLERIAEVLATPSREWVKVAELTDNEIMQAVDFIHNEVVGYRNIEARKAAEANARTFIDDIAPSRASEITAKTSDPTLRYQGVHRETPIKTVKERVAEKLANVEKELVDNKRLRADSIVDFNREIADLQEEYNSKANKNTKAANDILRRIERLQRVKNNVDADYEKTISDLEAKKAKLSQEWRTGTSATEQSIMRAELHLNKIDNIRAKFAEKGFDFDETLKKAKNLSTFSTVDNTPQRVMEKALGYREGQILADETVNKVAQNETEGIKWLNSYTDRKNGLIANISKQYNIKPGTKESAAAQMYAEGFYVTKDNEIVKYGDNELAIDFPDAKVQANIKGLARDTRIRQIYDETLDMINESRARNAYPEIQKLDNYFLHFRAMDDTFSRLGLPFNPNDIKAKDLPTDLNGVTADLKPGQPYFASANHREGIKTSYDLLGGLERYLSSAKNQIYHIDDIQTLRALRNHIADTYGQANGLEGLDALSEEEAQEKIKQVFDAHLSTFAKFLNEEANIIAGKTALIDRGFEGIFGRRAMTFMDTLNKQVGSNMVGFNVSSSLTNFIAPVQAFAKTNKAAFIKGFAQTVSNKLGSIVGKNDGFTESSPVMIRRKGADRFYRTPFQKVGDAGYVLMSAVDDISTEIIARAKYNELTAKGMSAEQAHVETDKWVSRLMGDRSLGQMPQLYNSKTLGIITKFQLEVRNQLDSQFYDTIQETKANNADIENALKRNSKTAAKVALVFTELAIAQHLFGKAFESIAGYNPAFDIIDVLIKMFGFDDDEESEDTIRDNIEQGFLALLEDLPYSSTLTGGRIPISSALPITELIKGEDEYGNEISRLKTLGEIAPYYILPGGYGQAKKTIQGLGMFSDEHPIAGSYTDSDKLRFPVDETFENIAQAAIFGQYANSNARDYFDNDIAPLNEKQTQEFIDVGITIQDYWKYREGLSQYKTLAEKADYIYGLDLTDEQKNVLINNIADREEDIDMSDYGNYGSFEEFDYANKYPEKYEFWKQNGISYEDYASGDDDTKAAYNWAFENPDKFTLSKAVADNVVTYRQYTKELYDLKADKDEDGKSITGSRKEKVIDYVNNLDIDYGSRIILFKSEYPADDTYNYDIIDYLNNREDISYEQMKTILTELGFTVDSKGNITWD